MRHLKIRKIGSTGIKLLNSCSGSKDVSIHYSCYGHGISRTWKILLCMR